MDTEPPSSGGPSQQRAEIDPLTLRLFYSLRDIQLALSAFDFLLELDVDQRYSFVELRRFRCYLDAGVIAYCRPFTDTRGVPLLSFKRIGVTPTPEQRRLHEDLREYRNKVVAHSDVERMRIAVTTTQPFDDLDLAMPIMSVDEGLPFLDRRDDLIVWLRTLRGALAAKTFALAQGPKPFRLRKDYLADAPTADSAE
ncbi:MAG: hypothetical protein KAG62_17000 [Caulobacter sp.]|nr:hypothetical protein [Caulobacter sp.]